MKLFPVATLQWLASEWLSCEVIHDDGTMGVYNDDDYVV